MFKCVFFDLVHKSLILCSRTHRVYPRYGPESEYFLLRFVQSIAWSDSTGSIEKSVQITIQAIQTQKALP